MIKKIHSFFLITLLLFFIVNPIHAQNIADDSLNRIEEAANDLKNIEKMPIAEDIGTIARTIRSVTETYQSLKSKIISTVDYCQNTIRSIRETWEKIQSGGLEIKNYIKDKFGLISKKDKINLLLI